MDEEGLDGLTTPSRSYYNLWDSLSPPLTPSKKIPTRASEWLMALRI